MHKIIAEQDNNKQKNHKLGHKQCSSAGRFFSTYSVGAVTLLILMVSIFGLNTVSATSSITLNVSPMVSLDALPDEGSTSTTDTTTIGIKTDNATGYKLSIAASSGNTNDTNVPLINTDTSCTGICTIPSIANDSTYASVDDFSLNTWGYMLSKYNTTTTQWDKMYAFYQAAPTTTGNDIETTETANNEDFNNYNLSIATKVDNTTPPGTYENTFIITAITNPLVYNVYYTNASGISASNMPTNISGGMTAAGDGSFTISSTTPTRTGYTFNKWCTVTPTTSNGVDACTGGDEYASSATYNLTGTTSPQSVTLYAMWTANTYNLVITGDGNVATMSVKEGSTTGTQTNCTKSGTTFTCSSLTYGINYYLFPTFASGYEFNSWAKTDSATNSQLSSTSTENAYYKMGAGAGALTLASKTSKIYMQIMSLSQCTTTPTTVYDSRDEQTYTVARLADGKCWMLDNLALDLYNTSVLNSLSSANTNINASSATAILKSLKSGNRSAGSQYATAGLTAWTSGSSYSVPMANLTNKEIPASYSTSEDPMKDTVIANKWKMGGYYNYCAASAGSYCYGDGTSSGTSSGNATSSICPKGWRLPTGNSSGEFATLYNAYSSASPSQYTAFRTAFRLPLSGAFYSGSFYYRGADGRWWSATRYDATAIYSLHVYLTGIRPSYSFNRRYGFTLRCVLGS